MIIKRITINNFGKLKNFTLDLSQGINVVYGENERGKSTIQAFLKAMLYGMPTKKEKGAPYSIRERYSSIYGDKISGELLIKYNSREYIIKRSFGRTKKDDTSNIFDALSGEEVKEFSYEEPGRSFLEINASTFSKTLFISQLGVAIEKDKEEEIMDRITNLFHNGENEVSIEKAIDTLNKNIKNLTTIRKVGVLDYLNIKRDELLQEKFEGYKVAEDTLDKEQRLKIALEERESYKSEINNLELYKKHIKKIKLQNEYKEILGYLKKSEELKKQKNEILNGIKSHNGIIDEDFVHELSEENNNYLNLLDIKNQAVLDDSNSDEIIEEIYQGINDYSYFNECNGDLKENILRVKIEQESLRIGIESSEALVKDIDENEAEYNNLKLLIPGYKILQNNNQDIIRSLSVYEDKLRELHEKSQRYSNYNDIEKKHKSIKIKKLISGIGIGLSVLMIMVGSSMGYMLPSGIVGVILILVSVLMLNGSSNKEKIILNQLNEKNALNILKQEIELKEKELMEFGKSVGARNYEDLMYKLKTFQNSNAKLETLKVKIEAKKQELVSRRFEENKNKYIENARYISEWLNKTKSEDLDEILCKYDEYEKQCGKVDGIINEKENRKKYIDRLTNELMDKEGVIKSKLAQIDLDHIDMLDVAYYLKELRTKLKKRNEILGELNSVEQTYMALIKDRDIDLIKEDVKELLDLDAECTYKNEEEIDEEVKKRSVLLIDIEKEIRDLKNFIENRFIGKRKIVEIEEELRGVEEEIYEKSLKLKALKIAMEKMQETSLKIRDNIGPLLNSKIVRNIKYLAGDDFEEVLLGEDYSMKVRKSGELFPAEFLSNGAKDQLYLALRIAFINSLFNNKDHPIFFDDAFVQYDDERRKNVLIFISSLNMSQVLIFTCHRLEKEILENNNIEYRYFEI